MVEAERGEDCGIWTIPEDTILTYFQMRWWGDILAMVNHPFTGTNSEVIEFVEEKLTELLTPSARVALKQVGTTQTIYVGWSNARESIRSAIPWRQKELFGGTYSSL